MKSTRRISLILAAILSALPFAACGETEGVNQPENSSTSDGSEVTAEVKETSGVPEGTDLGGETISIWYTTKSVSVAETYVDLTPS